MELIKFRRATNPWTANAYPRAGEPAGSRAYPPAPAEYAAGAVLCTQRRDEAMPWN